MSILAASSGKETVLTSTCHRVMPAWRSYIECSQGNNSDIDIFQGPGHLGSTHLWQPHLVRGPR